MMTSNQEISARGQQTREALIAAAIEIFGHDGFEAAGTRRIAAAAGCNQALIGYHFGGKPGLYTAALQHIVARVTAHLGGKLETIRNQLAAIDQPGLSENDAGERCLELIYSLTDAVAAVLTSSESTSWARIILREQQDPSDGFRILYEGFMRPLLGVLTRLIARIRRSDPDAPETRLLAITMLGQLLVFRAARAAIMRQMDWNQIGDIELRAIQARVRRNIKQLIEES